VAKGGGGDGRGKAANLDSIPSTIAAIQAVSMPDFTGMFADATSLVINHGNGGLFVDDPLPYADEAIALGCCFDDFIMLSVAHLQEGRPNRHAFWTACPGAIRMGVSDIIIFQKTENPQPDVNGGISRFVFPMPKNARIGANLSDGRCFGQTADQPLIFQILTQGFGIFLESNFTQCPHSAVIIVDP
jgi:hypothetical protein